MSLEECVLECFNNDEFVNEFCRLKGIKRPDKLTPLEKEIDKSCGFDSTKKFIVEFTNVVFRCVYIPLVTGMCEYK